MQGQFELTDSRVFRTKWAERAARRPGWYVFGLLAVVFFPIIGLVVFLLLLVPNPTTQQSVFSALFDEPILMPVLVLGLFFVVAVGLVFYYPEVFHGGVIADSRGIERVPSLRGGWAVSWDKVQRCFTATEDGRVVEVGVGIKRAWLRVRLNRFAERDRLERTMLLGLATLPVAGLRYARRRSEVWAARSLLLVSILTILAARLATVVDANVSLYLLSLLYTAALNGAIGSAAGMLSVPPRERYARVLLPAFVVLFGFMYGTRFSIEGILLPAALQSHSWTPSPSATPYLSLWSFLFGLDLRWMVFLSVLGALVALSFYALALAAYWTRSD